MYLDDWTWSCVSTSQWEMCWFAHSSKEVEPCGTDAHTCSLSVNPSRPTDEWEPGWDQQLSTCCVPLSFNDWLCSNSWSDTLKSILRFPQRWQKRLAIKCKKALIMGTKCSIVWTVSLKETCLYQILLWGSDHLPSIHMVFKILMLIYYFMAYKTPFCKPGDHHHSTLTGYYLLSYPRTGKESHHSSAYLNLSSKFSKFRPTNNAYTPLPVFLIIWLPRLEAEWHHD